MSFEYPRMGKCVKYIRKSEDVVEVTDYLTNQSFECNMEVTAFIRKLDGKRDPFSIPTTLSYEDICFILDELEKMNFFEQSRIRKGFGEILIGLWYPRNTKDLKKFAKYWNTLLMIIWIPFTVVGGILGYTTLTGQGFEYNAVGLFLGIIITIIIHELSHAFAAVAFGARAFELGIGLTNFVMVCAYTMTDGELICDRMKRAQGLFAGVESGLFLAGAFAILGYLFTSANDFMMSAATASVMMSATNILFISGFDGNAVMSELLGVSFARAAPIKILFSKKCRTSIAHTGEEGKAVLIVLALFAMTYIIIPLYLIFLIVGWFLL